MLSGKYAPVKPELTLIESFSLPQEIDRHCSSLRLSLFVFCFSTYLPRLWFNKAPIESFPYMQPTNQYPTQQCAPLSLTLLCLHSALPNNMSILINSTNLGECLTINIIWIPADIWNAKSETSSSRLLELCVQIRQLPTFLGALFYKGNHITFI